MLQDARIYQVVVQHDIRPLETLHAAQRDQSGRTGASPYQIDFARRSRCLLRHLARRSFTPTKPALRHLLSLPTTLQLELFAPN